MNGLGRLSIAVVFSLVLLISVPLAAQVRGPLVVSDKWPECTDLLTWAHDVFRLEGVENGTETAKAKVFHNWLRLFNHLCEENGGMAHANEGAWGEEGFLHDAHKHLFVYGWGYCSTHALIAEALWQELMGDSLAADRVICMHENGGFHTMHRLRMDGKYGAFDARYGYYLIEKDTPDARILDWEEVGDDANVWANLKYKNRCKPLVEFPQHEFERVLWLKNKPIFKNQTAWEAAGSPAEVVFRDRVYKMGTKFHDMNFVLPRGTTIERHWDNKMKKWYMPKSRDFKFMPEGRFYRIGDEMVGGDGERNDPNWRWIEPYATEVPTGLGYPEYLEGQRTQGQAWGLISYLPDLGRGDLAEIRKSGNGLDTFSGAPYIRPSQDGGSGEWILEFYSPYVMVDGSIFGELAGGEGDEVEIAFRNQVAKRSNADEEDRWLPWVVVSDKPGREFRCNLDRADAAEGLSTFHGAYKVQLRIRLKAAGAASEVGINKLAFTAYFENGMMSIPQIFDGDNTVRFKVQDSKQVTSTLKVAYNWTTEDGEVQETEVNLIPEMFYKDNEAVFNISAPGLKRCNWMSMSNP